MSFRRVAPFLFFATAACVAVPREVPEPQMQAATEQPPRPAPTPTATATSVTVPGPPLSPPSLEGQYEQGGFIRGKAPFGTVSATIDGEPLDIASDRFFFVGLDRDSGSEAVLVFKSRDRQQRTDRITVKPRDWNIERVNVARRAGGASESFMQRRRPELEAIWTARQQETGAQGWRQDMVWPVTGRISGRFGSQRIYRGEPGSYHSGLDIAGGAGTTYVAPADGVVVLSEPDFSLEGQLLIIDHGQGLNSAFLHSSELFVKQGDTVSQGQPIGRIGSSGRATGPHLHWSLVWRDKRLDPLLFLPPMP